MDKKKEKTASNAYDFVIKTIVRVYQTMGLKESTDGFIHAGKKGVYSCWERCCKHSTKYFTIFKNCATVIAQCCTQSSD